MASEPALLEHPVRHPARFSDRLLDVIACQLVEAGTSGRVLDPFAGTGRVHELGSRLGLETVGVELEPEWAGLHPGTLCGDAREIVAVFGASSFDAVVTSPTYGNRMADHHDARDGSTRHTYRHSLGRELNPGNTGAMQWGSAYRKLHRAVWEAVVEVVRPAGVVIVNVKNHVRSGTVQRVAEWHFGILAGLGLDLELLDAVETRGRMAGANASVRVDHELVATFRKPCEVRP